MNEDQYPVVRKSSNGCFWTILVAIALVIATGVIVFLCHEPIAKIVTSEDESVCIDTAKAHEPVLTIQEVLKFRESVKEGMRIDSIFLAMPEAILVDILMTHGTSLSNSDIVYIYESNKEHFKDIKTGADIQKNILTIDSVKNPRDSLRRQRQRSTYLVSLLVKVGQSSVNDKPVGRKQYILFRELGLHNSTKSGVQEYTMIVRT